MKKYFFVFILIFSGTFFCFPTVKALNYIKKTEEVAGSHLFIYESDCGPKFGEDILRKYSLLSSTNMTPPRPSINTLATTPEYPTKTYGAANDILEAKDAFSTSQNYFFKERAIIVPDKVLNSKKTKTIYIYFHGIGWDEHDSDNLCKDYGLCQNASKLANLSDKNIDPVIFAPRLLNLGKRKQEISQGEFKCFLDEALKILSQDQNILVTYDNANIILSGSSGGGNVIRQFVQKKPSGTPPILASLFFDASYYGWAHDTAANNNSGQVYIYFRDATKNDSGETHNDAINTIKDYPNKTKVLDVNIAHAQFPVDCFLDHINDDKCDNKAITDNHGTNIHPPIVNVFGNLAGMPPSVIQTNLNSSPNSQIYNEVQKEIIVPQPRITLPGLKFSSAEEVAALTTNEADGTYMYIPFLGEYLAAVYKYIIAICSIIATFIIIWNGFDWVFSFGVAENINSAKKRIGEALIGLFIALTSYTLLYFINPELVQFKNLKILYVKEDLLDSVGNDAVQEENKNPPQLEIFKDIKPAPLPNTGGLNYGFNGVPYYYQGFSANSPWGNERYGRESHCTTFADGGCGPTSFAMVFRFYGLNVDPRKVGQIGVSSGARTCAKPGEEPQGTNAHTLIEALLKEAPYNQLKIEWISGKDRIDKALKLLREKKPLIQSGAHIGYTNKNTIKQNRSHYIVLTGVDNINGQEIIRVNDSANNNPSGGIVYLTMEQFKKAPRNFIYIHP